MAFKYLCVNVRAGFFFLCWLHGFSRSIESIELWHRLSRPCKSVEFSQNVQKVLIFSKKFQDRIIS